jgi:hypothetical protein
MAITVPKDSLPEGARISSGNTKDPVGVIEDGLVADRDVLAAQVERFAANRTEGAQIYQDGAKFDPEIVDRIRQNTFQGITNFNQDTINALQSGEVTRDGTFAGNNANFTGYYLEPAAKFIIPQMTPLRNMTPRDPIPGIDTVNWRTVLDYFGGTGPTVAGAAVQQFGTPSQLSYQFASLSNVAKLLAYRDVVSFESEIYGKMWQGDVRATVAAKLIPALMQEEEFWLINSGQRLWSPPPVNGLVAATTGGLLAAGTYWFLVTALNANGETLALGGATPTATAVTTTGTTSVITMNINCVPSATKYQVYAGIGATQPANSAMWLQGSATQFIGGSANTLNQPTNTIRQGYFTVTFGLAAALTAGTAYSTTVTATNTAIVVKSTDANTLNLPLTIDGAQALIYNNFGTPGSLGIAGETPIIAQPANPLGTLALSDIDTVLENMYISAHADPDYMFVGIKDHKKISYLVAQGTNFRVTQTNDTGMGSLVAGQRVTKYINQTTGKVLDVIMLPYLGQGTIMIGSFSIPFPVTAIDKPPFRVGVNRDMFAVEYPPDQSHWTQWGYAAYENITLVNQYLGGWSLITGITLT